MPTSHRLVASLPRRSPASSPFISAWVSPTSATPPRPLGARAGRLAYRGWPKLSTRGTLLSKSLGRRLMRYFTGGLIVSILTIVAFSLKSDPALAAGCPGYSSSAATISPCVGPPNSIVVVTMRRRNIVPQAVSFHTGVKNGIAVGGLTTVTQGAAGYTFVVPAALCAAGSGSQFAVKLSGANNQDEGEIGRFTIDCRARLVSGRYRVVSGVFVAMFSLTVNSSNIT